MVERIAIHVTPEIFELITKATKYQRKLLIDMGYDPDNMTQGTYAEEMLPLWYKFKSDVVDLCGQEVSMFHCLLSEYRGFLEGRLNIELVPAEYILKVRTLLDLTDSLLEKIS